MKKIVTTLVALGYLLVVPAVFAAETSGGTQGAAMAQHDQKAVRKTRHRISAEQIKAIQEALNAHGATLTVTGQWNRKTREAIREYQKENGLKPTGRANKKTRKLLGLDF